MDSVFLCQSFYKGCIKKSVNYCYIIVGCCRYIKRQNQYAEYNENRITDDFQWDAGRECNSRGKRRKIMKKTEKVEKTVTEKNKGRMKQSTAVKLLSGLSAMAIVLVFGMLILNIRASNKYDVMTEKGDRTSGYVESFVDASAYLTEEVRSYVATGDRTHYDNYWQEVNTDQTREKAVAALKELGITAEESELISKIQSLSNGLVPIEDRAMKMTEQGVNPKAIELVYGSEYENTVDEIKELQDKLTTSIWERAEAEQNRLGKLIDRTFYFTFASLILVAAIQMLVIFYVLRHILAPLLCIEENMLQMAEGNLDVKLDVNEDETELGMLAKAINGTKQHTVNIVKDLDYVLGEMAKGNFTVTVNHTEHYKGDYEPILLSMRKLKKEQSKTLLQIGMAADQVAMGSEQVSDGAQALAQGATEQASAVEELSATISEISDNAKNNAENSTLALEHSQSASSFVSESAENIRAMISAMNEISQSSQEIGKIIASIENIAFQTNILALNAAVEAARAGEAGKGFAVVADEVRNLASKSDEAAKATKELIVNSIESVKHGETIVSQVSEALSSTIEASQQAEKDIAQITNAITEETESIAQVADGIEQISAVVQTNSATSEESASASAELFSQAQMMKDLVSCFQLNEE